MLLFRLIHTIQQQSIETLNVEAAKAFVSDGNLLYFQKTSVCFLKKKKKNIRDFNKQVFSVPLEPIRVFMNMCSALKGLKEEHLSNLLNEIKKIQWSFRSKKLYFKYKVFLYRYIHMYEYVRKIYNLNLIYNPPYPFVHTLHKS